MDWEKGLGPRLPGVFSLLCFADSGVRVWARGPRFLLPAGPAGATQCSAAETPEQVALCQLLTFLLLEKLLPARGGAAAPRALQPPSPPSPPRVALWVSVLVRSSLSHHWSWPPLSECPSLPLTHEPTPVPCPLAIVFSGAHFPAKVLVWMEVLPLPCPTLFSVGVL